MTANLVDKQLKWYSYGTHRTKMRHSEGLLRAFTSPFLWNTTFSGPFFLTTWGSLADYSNIIVLAFMHCNMIYIHYLAVLGQGDKSRRVHTRMSFSAYRGAKMKLWIIFIFVLYSTISNILNNVQLISEYSMDWIVSNNEIKFGCAHGSELAVHMIM